jgi:uncharacterized protein (TIGR03000 family)
MKRRVDRTSAVDTTREKNMRPSRLSGLLAAVARGLVPVTAVVLTATLVRAGWPPPGVPSGVMPWEISKYQGYKQPPHGYGPRPASPQTVTRSPQAHTLQVTVLPYKHEYDERNAALVIAHLPEDALLSLEGQLLGQTGQLRQFLSPPLVPGKDYLYTVEVAWPENGEWVRQLHTFPIHAGEVHCIDIVPAGALSVDQEVKASLAKLSPEDRALAEKQRFCAVQNGTRLGAMGVPVKIELDGKPVLLCCPACEGPARMNADQTLAQFQKLIAKPAADKKAP